MPYAAQRLGHALPALGPVRALLVAFPLAPALAPPPPQLAVQLCSATSRLLWQSLTSPNGWIFELAYLPFNRGGPAFWPWLNFRIGLQYTHWTKFDGATTNINGTGRNASGNNTLFAYIWTMF